MHSVSLTVALSLSQECVLSSLMSQSGKKVLHIDKNADSGGSISHLEEVGSHKHKHRPTSSVRQNCGYFSHLSCFILFYLQLFKKFKVPGPAKSMEHGKAWNIDLIPKFFLANGKSKVHAYVWFVRHCSTNEGTVIFCILLLCLCIRRASENLGAHWGYSISGLQSCWRQLRIQSRQSAQSPELRGGCHARLRWWTWRTINAHY